VVRSPVVKVDQWRGHVAIAREGIVGEELLVRGWVDGDVGLFELGCEWLGARSSGLRDFGVGKRAEKVSICVSRP
jgi:hypothetical protein